MQFFGDPARAMRTVRAGLKLTFWGTLLYSAGIVTLALISLAPMLMLPVLVFAALLLWRLAGATNNPLRGESSPAVSSCEN